jgi:hypothetical protein
MTHATPKILVLSFALMLATAFLLIHGYEIMIFITLYSMHVLMAFVLRHKAYH